jgi:hypothetical protein
LDDVKKTLGNPDADKTDKLDVLKIGKWLDPKRKEKIFHLQDTQNDSLRGDVSLQLV